MQGREPTRRGDLTIEAIDPHDGKTLEVIISFRRLQAVLSRGMGAAMEVKVLVYQALQKPSAIFEGLTRDDDEVHGHRGGVGWRCYVCQPGVAFGQDGRERQPWPGQIFMVFVSDERVAYNWRWERSDQDDPALPENHDQRFKRRLL